MTQILIWSGIDRCSFIYVRKIFAERNLENKSPTQKHKNQAGDMDDSTTFFGSSVSYLKM